MANKPNQQFPSGEAVIEVSADHKAIQAMALDKSGFRMVTGGMDGTVKLFDFGSSRGSLSTPIAQLTPVPDHSINALSYNSTNSLILCITSDSKARIYDRDFNSSSRPIEETIKGDPYIRTPENTKGHTHMLSCGSFHPTDASRFMTGSYDCTVRLWDMNTKRIGMDQNIPNLNCFKCVDSRGICGGTGMYVTSSSYSPDGTQIVAGCSDGSIQLFHEKYKYGKPLSIARPAHASGEVCNVEFHQGSEKIISRGFDGCIKIWDLRMLKKSQPLHVFDNFPTDRSGSNFSIQNDSSLIAGTDTGELVSVNITTGMVQETRKFSTRSFIKIVAVDGEIFASTSDGNVFVVFDETLASKWTEKSSEKAGVSLGADTRQIDYQIYSYDDLVSGGKYRENRQGDIRQIRQPLQRRILPPGGSLQPEIMRAENDAAGARGHDIPLASTQKHLLSFDESLTGEEGLWVGAAYKRTQPEPILDYSDIGTSADSLLKKKQYCPRCGLKMCTCGYLASLEKRPRQ